MFLFLSLHLLFSQACLFLFCFKTISSFYNSTFLIFNMINEEKTKFNKFIYHLNEYLKKNTQVEQPALETAGSR